MGNRMQERDFRKNMNMGHGGRENRSGRAPTYRGEFGAEGDERRFNPQEDMGGSSWSGYSGRGGMTDEQSYRGEPWQGRDQGWQRPEQSWQDRERSAWQNRNLQQGHEQSWQGASPWHERSDRGGSYGQGTQSFSGSSGGGAYENRGYSSGRSTLGSENRGYGASGAQDPFGTSQRGYGSEQFGYAGGGSDMGIGERSSNRGPHFGKGPKGYKRSDDRIREEVCEALYHQGHIDASDVEVKVTNGEVVLTGTVSDRREKREIEQMLDQIAGVEDVKNEIRVKREETGASSNVAGTKNGGNLAGKEPSAVQDRHGRS